MHAKEQGAQELNGKDVWCLYDMFGFPVDLTCLMADELGFGVNDKELEEVQAWSEEASKTSPRKGNTGTVKLDVHDITMLEKNDSIMKTDDSVSDGRNTWPPLTF